MVRELSKWKNKKWKTCVFAGPQSLKKKFSEFDNIWQNEQKYDKKNLAEIGQTNKNVSLKFPKLDRKCQ